MTALRGEKPHLAFVDGLRAIAVLSVLAYHSAVANDASFSSLVFCGSRGVALFFVISGFCLAFPFLHTWRTASAFHLDKRVYGMFLLRRFSRIAPPFYAVLTLFALLAFTPFGFPNASGQDTSIMSAVHDYFFSLLFLTSRFPLFNASFWTLGIEARWYLLCPLLIALYVRSRAAFVSVGTLMYVLYFFTPFGIVDEGTLPCFMLGIVAADAVLLGRPWRRFAWIAASVLLGTAVWEQSRSATSDAGDPLWHVACFFLVVAGSTGMLRRLLEWRPLAAIGVASYSIYLVHGPFIEVFVKNGLPRPAAALAGLALGFAAYRLIEKPLSDRSFRSSLERTIVGIMQLRSGPAALEPEVAPTQPV